MLESWGKKGNYQLFLGLIGRHNSLYSIVVGKSLSGRSEFVLSGNGIKDSWVFSSGREGMSDDTELSYEYVASKC